MERIDQQHTDQAPAAGAAPEPQGSPIDVAVFDFDGTCITGNSPVLLVKYLMRKGRVRFSVLARICAWGVAYKMHLPQNEAWVRSLVFSAFEGESKATADAEMYDFYDEWIEERIRPKAVARMREHLAAGHEVWIVSATFDPIIVRARKDIPYSHHVATEIRVDAQGRYTREVEGKPVEGAEKLHQIQDHADEVYGKGKWRLAAAYGDHYSDAPLLAAADRAFAVTPDHTLARLAERKGWTILDWQ